tara:strand:+ start:53 stop:835 length:783 start_codon:yes stop_codon:yes gene_type:complete
MNKNKLLDVAVEAAIASSNVIMGALKNPKKVNFKGKTDLVTSIDKESEVLIKAIIKSSFPDHDFLAEESGKEGSLSDFLWIIDPLDGTTNFVHNYPSFAVSIGLLYQGIPTISVVLEMPHVKLYSAIVSEGAYCEGIKISCSSTPKLIQSLLTTGFGYDHGALWEKNMKLFKHFTNITQGVRRLGAAAIDICHVADGKIDGFWEYDLYPWDTAAGILIAKEAGCAISNIEGNPYDINKDKSIVITNPFIYKSFLNEVKSI